MGPLKLVGLQSMSSLHGVPSSQRLPSSHFSGGSSVMPFPQTDFGAENVSERMNARLESMGASFKEVWASAVNGAARTRDSPIRKRERPLRRFKIMPFKRSKWSASHGQGRHLIF